jgi:KRAB domain-containing zinc finger protein
MDVPAQQKQKQVVIDVQRKKIEKEYKCLECGKIFSKYKYLYQHKKMHERIIYRCVLCPSTYKSRDGLKYHLRTEHELRKFECHHCQKTFKGKRGKHSLVTHMSVHFNSIEKEYKCLECGKIFSKNQSLWQHKKMHEGIIYRCVQCPSTYESKHGLDYHSKTVHELRKFECHHCQTTFTTKSSLLNHMTLHFNSIVYPCNQCSAQFFKLAAFRKHLLICPKSNVNLNCMDVPAPLKQAQVVNDVKKVEKEYKCLECGKIFSKYQIFYNHKKRHEGIIYRCVQCPATFKSKSGLNIHSKTVHALRKFECHHCHNTFKTKKRLATHLRTQHKMNHIECNYCGKILESKMFLILHNMVTHKKKIQCNECSAMFKNHYKLEDHLKEIHLIEECHKCPHCSIVFNTESCLNDHMVAHQTPKVQVVPSLEKYPCRDCPKIFNSISDLSVHMLEQCFAEGF